MISRTITLAFSGTAAMLLFAGPVQSASVTQCGPNVCYTYDNAQAGIGLIGLPTLVGDSMQFLLSDFIAESLDGAGLDTAGGTPNGLFYFDAVYTVVGGDSITAFTVSEVFDYDIINDGSVSAQLDLVAQQGAGLANDSSLFGVSGDTGGTLVNVLTAQVFPTMTFGFPATNMEVWVTNTLTANTDAFGESAFIQKKLTLATATVMNSVVVPVPAAVWLMASALGLLGVLRRFRGCC